MTTDQYQDSLHPLASLYKQFTMYDAHESAKKALDLLEKQQNQELVIGFAGHFSAGKSTMINTLLKEELLPSSPIPTSANLVKIKKGEGYARVYFSEDDPIEYPEPYNIDRIQQFCKDGDAIKELELTKKDTHLVENVTILDTPGIDSSNDADRIMTESALHIVDVLFYVMDYNHVQSEVNLAFLSEMQKKDKPLYIIVNQIDKHDESELPFSSFKQSVYDALNNWSIETKGIYFTTLTDPELQHNQFQQMKSTLEQLIDQKNFIIKETITNSSKTLITDYITQLKEDNKDVQEDLEKKLASFQKDEGEPSSQQQMIETKAIPENAEDDLRQRVDHSLRNATLMPYEVREKARSFIESQQSNFKVGFFFTKSKTEEARKERLDSFYEAISEQAKAKLEWPVRKALVETAKSYHVFDETTLQKFENFTITFAPDLLKDTIQKGAGSGGDYVLQYSEDVSREIKRLVKDEALKSWGEASHFLESEKEDKLEQLKAKQESENQYLSYKQKLESLHKDLTERKESLINIRSGDLDIDGALDDATSTLFAREQRVRRNAELDVKVPQSNDKPQPRNEKNLKPQKKKEVTIEEAIERLDETHSALEPLQGFGSLQQDLLEKKSRLQSRHYTIALFGAFSAGKSSFANALLGEAVLPVSPNPTTATINKILPASDEYPHGSVRVKVKQSEDLKADLAYATDHYSENFENIDQLVEWIKEDNTRISTITPDQKRWSFLQAVTNGYSYIRKHLGGTLEVGLEEFKEFVSNEERSCFIEWMELYYDCALTREGITLVDTPGADSVNARHTETSFEYIKEADAILFVTYYNHAFSGADRDFLLQLGRVKDAFSMDKMFFVVNASDLAKTKEELDLVTNYVEDQLLQYGIRSPRLFPVSSKMALEERAGKSEITSVTGTSGIMEFEQSFHSFIQQELVQLLIHAAFHDLERAKNTIEHYIHSASLDQKQKEKKKIEYQTEKNEIVSRIESSDKARYEQAIENKVTKQTYYVQERLSLAFSDLFKQSFNPAVIKGNGKEAKEALQKSFNHLKEMIEHELLQELRAVTIRIETFTNETAKEWKQDLEEKCSREVAPISLPYYEDKKILTPEIQPHLSISIKDKAIEQALGLFKNTKAFFEHNEKEKMKEALLEGLLPQVESVIKANDDLLIRYYLAEWNKVTEEYQDKSKRSVEEYYNGLLGSLEERVDLDALKNTKQQIEHSIR
ncbi:GTPase [Pontibacillus chungwhensis BH030062]|uniref:GTPase n=1 Tax=Pontibacillus chungwhensis BH030062 TaxID=1385513 RepID=A0A0A2V2K2_9BACI|nr:dynamin family protein [Pontibacillus chungwhensis]KGP93046.1 GTPase [Pontibacillus chungwhensis BH030062]